MKINSEMLDLLIEAVSMHKDDVELLLSKLPKNHPDATRSRSEIDSIQKKLSNAAKGSELNFTADESKHIYFALKQLRQGIEESLADPTSDDREIALALQKTCNALLRDFRHQLLDAGIEIEKVLSARNTLIPS